MPESPTLEHFLSDTFSETELLRWAEIVLGDRIRSDLPGGNASLVDLAWVVVKILRRRRIPASTIFSSLEVVRPLRAAEIMKLHEAWKMNSRHRMKWSVVSLLCLTGVVTAGIVQAKRQISHAMTCQAPESYIVCDTGLDLNKWGDRTLSARSIGICNASPKDSVITTDWRSSTGGWRIARGFGSFAVDHDGVTSTPPRLLYSPREGETFLMLSTGPIAVPNADGIIIENPSSESTPQFGNGNSEKFVALPMPMSPHNGSNDGTGGSPFVRCDGVNDCSDTLEAIWESGVNPLDHVWFTLKTKVPAETYGYSFDFVFCSSEWPNWIDTPFGDIFIGWQTNSRVPSDDDRPFEIFTGNVATVPQADGMKVHPATASGFSEYFSKYGFSADAPQLAHTGFEGHACTDWLTVRGGVHGESELELGFFLTDMGDRIGKTLVLLDNFRWDCKGCIPRNVDDCGVQIRTSPSR